MEGMKMSNTLNNRYEFVLYFDVENGNPNGDPDAGNMPRIDPQTGYGIITDVCLKRKVRNYVDIKKDRSEGYDIYVTESAVLNNKQVEAYEANNLKRSKEPDQKTKQTAQDYMCKRFFDIRTFGAVLDTGDAKCGQVRGPIQLCFSKSQDPIFQQEITITRMAVTKEEDLKKKRTMGNKYIVPYALYRAEGFVSANFAKKTGFTEDDLALFWDALQNMFDHDHSAARGKMVSRKLFVFKHESELGNAPAVTLFDKIIATRLDDSKPPREYADYKITIDHEMPTGVELLELL
jgi:CRISPR-associated protein Csd2